MDKNALKKSKKLDKNVASRVSLDLDFKIASSSEASEDSEVEKSVTSEVSDVSSSEI